MPSVAGTVNVTQTSGDYGPIFNDGEGGTTDISGIQYNFFFGDAAQNVIGDVQSVQNVLVNPITELVSSVSDNSIKTFIISSNSGAEFGLNSFLTQDGEQVDANWTATGYRAGVAVATFNYTIPQSGDVDATINLPGTFGDVDKVVVTAQGGLDGDGIDFTGFNHFVFADPPDTTPPTVTVTVANTALIAGQTSAVTFTFSEAVTGFTNADLVIANGALSNVTSSDGITFTATLTPTAGITDATNTIAVNMTGVQDQSANVGVGATNSNNYAIDTAPPTSSIVVANTALTAGATSLVTIHFSEAVTGLTLGDLTTDHGALSGLSTSDNITFTATLTPTAGFTGATNHIVLDDTGVTDAAGNLGVGTTNSNNYAIDTAPPTSSIVVANTALTAGATSLVTIHFSEAVTGLTLSDLTTDHGALSGLSTSDNITYQATLTPTAGFTGATNHIVLDDAGVTDTAGNLGVGTTNSNNYAIDTAPPTAGIVVSHTPLEIGETSPVTITFSEAVNGFTNSDLTVDHGLLSAVTSIDGGITWHATLTPTAGLTDATNLITLNDAGVTDAAGNFGVGTSMSNNYAIDTTTLPPPPPPPTTDPDTPPVTIEAGPGPQVVAGNDLPNVIISGDGGDTVSGGLGADTVQGGLGNDVIQGNTGQDSIAAGAGADIAYGGQDNDMLQGNAGADRMFGDKGDDSVYGGQGADMVQGGEGNDFVSGDKGDDVVLGGKGDDSASGGDGNDTLSGDLGNDTLSGGPGADVFHTSGATGVDRVMDFNLAEGDRVEVDPGTTFTLAQVGSDTVITMGGGGQVVLVGVQLSTLHGDWIFGA